MARPRPAPARRFGPLRFLVAAAVASALALAYGYEAFRIVFRLRIGPTMVVVNESRGWGVHSGDALALPVAVLAVAFLAVAVTCAEYWAHPRPVAALVPRRRGPRPPGAGGARR